jgi:hypothetical protein
MNYNFNNNNVVVEGVPKKLQTNFERKRKAQIKEKTFPFTF